MTNKNFIQQFVDQYKVESNRLLIQNTAVVLTQTGNSGRQEVKVQKASSTSFPCTILVVWLVVQVGCAHNKTTDSTHQNEICKSD